MSNRQIANKIGVAPQTIHNEIKRGDLKQVKLFNGKTRYFTDYNAEFAQNMYQMNRLNCHRKEKFPKARAFLSFFVPLFKTKGYSPDATVAKCHSLFAPKEMVSTTTFYKIIDDQRLEVRNIDLEMKMKRCITKKRPEKNRKVLGKSISSVTSREEFGHFEIDTVIGRRNGAETALLTLTERKTRFEIIRAIDAAFVTYAINQLIHEYGASFSSVFRSITSDNGSEFAQLSDSLSGLTDVYLTHPYTSCERGTNENHNRMIRRYIPKGASIDAYSRQFIEEIAEKMNQLPRKILGYLTPQTAFEQAPKQTLS